MKTVFILGLTTLLMFVVIPRLMAAEDYIITVYSQNFITIEHDGVIHAWARPSKDIRFKSGDNQQNFESFDQNASLNEQQEQEFLRKAQQEEQKAIETGNPRDYFRAADLYKGYDDEKSIEMANREIEILLSQPEPNYGSTAVTCITIFKNKELHDEYKQKHDEQVESCGGVPESDNPKDWAKFYECTGDYRSAKEYYLQSDDLESIKRIINKQGY